MFHNHGCQSYNQMAGDQICIILWATEGLEHTAVNAAHGMLCSNYLWSEWTQSSEVSIGTAPLCVLGVAGRKQ